MPMTRGDYSALYTPIYDEFMMMAFDEETQVHTRIFQQINDKTKEYKTNSMSTLGRWVDADEGASGGYETPVLGYAKTYTPSKSWKKLKVSFEAHDQDEYALVKQEGNARMIGIGARDHIEYSHMRILAGGFANEGPDNLQALFSNEHPKNTEETSTYHDNLLEGEFSFDNLELAETQIANYHQTPTGVPIPYPTKPLLVFGPSLRGAVDRVLNDRALERPSTTLRDTNRFAGKFEPIEWRYLASKFGGNDNYWFIIFPGLNFFKTIWQARPHFTSWIDEDAEFYIWKGRMIYDCGYSDWRGAFGSTGSA